MINKLCLWINHIPMWNFSVKPQILPAAQLQSSHCRCSSRLKFQHCVPLQCCPGAALSCLKLRLKALNGTNISCFTTLLDVSIMTSKIHSWPFYTSCLYDWNHSVQRCLAFWVKVIKLIKVLYTANLFNDFLHSIMHIVLSIPQSNILHTSFHSTPGKVCRAQQQLTPNWR